MIKFNAKLQPLSVSYATPPESDTTHRLIVPVPSLDGDLTAITRRIWDLAEATRANIKFIGLCNDSTQEPGLRRTLVTMTAMVNYGNISADTEVVIGKDWTNAVKSRCRAGDMVVCWDEPHTGLLRKPLSQLLQSELNVPLYILSGLSPENDSHTNWAMLITAWIGFIAIIIGFFMLQVKIYQLANNWTITLEILSTAVEFWLIWVWNNLFG